MKRTDAALTAELVSRLGNHDQMKKLRFSSPLNVRPLTFLAIDVLAGATPRRRRQLDPTETTILRRAVGKPRP